MNKNRFIKRFVPFLTAVALVFTTLMVSEIKAEAAGKFDPIINRRSRIITLNVKQPEAGDRTSDVGCVTFSKTLKNTLKDQTITVAERWYRIVEKDPIYPELEEVKTGDEFIAGEEYEYEAEIKTTNYNINDYEVKTGTFDGSVTWMSSDYKITIAGDKCIFTGYTVVTKKAGVDKGEYTLNLSGGSAKVTGEDAKAVLYNIIGSTADGTTTVIGDRDLSSGVVFDLNKDGKGDIQVTATDFSDPDMYAEFKVLSTNTVKENVIISLGDKTKEGLVLQGFNFYGKLNLIFTKPTEEKPVEETPAPKVEDPAAAPAHKVGDKISSGGASYTITSVEEGKQTVTYEKPEAANVKSATIPDTINVDGTEFKVTEIAPGAFKNNKKLKKIIIGSNIEKIGKDAFKGCKNLKNIKIKTKLLTKKSVGSGAFKKIHPAAKCKVPKKVLKAYKKFLPKKGLNGKGQKITK